MQCRDPDQRHLQRMEPRPLQLDRGAAKDRGESRIERPGRRCHATMRIAGYDRGRERL
jgi:hypothetical protein